MPRVIASSELLVRQAVSAIAGSSTPTFEAVVKHIRSMVPKDAPLPAENEFTQLIRKSLETVVAQGKVIKTGSSFRCVEAGERVKPLFKRTAQPARGERKKLRRESHDESGKESSDSDKSALDHPPFEGSFLPCPAHVPGDLCKGDHHQ